MLAPIDMSMSVAMLLILLVGASCDPQTQMTDRPKQGSGQSCTDTASVEDAIGDLNGDLVLNDSDAATSDCDALTTTQKPPIWPAAGLGQVHLPAMATVLTNVNVMGGDIILTSGGGGHFHYPYLRPNNWIVHRISSQDVRNQRIRIPSGTTVGLPNLVAGPLGGLFFAWSEHDGEAGLLYVAYADWDTEDLLVKDLSYHGFISQLKYGGSQQPTMCAVGNQLEFVGTATDATTSTVAKADKLLESLAVDNGVVLAAGAPVAMLCNQEGTDVVRELPGTFQKPAETFVDGNVWDPKANWTLPLPGVENAQIARFVQGKMSLLAATDISISGLTSVFSVSVIANDGKMLSQQTTPIISAAQGWHAVEVNGKVASWVVVRAGLAYAQGKPTMDAEVQAAVAADGTLLAVAKRKWPGPSEKALQYMVRAYDSARFVVVGGAPPIAASSPQWTGVADAKLWLTDAWGETDSSVSGGCQQLQLIDCADSELCTFDQCDAAHNGCYHVPLPDDVSCATNKTCKSGTCTANPKP